MRYLKTIEYECQCCGKRFDEPEEIKTTWERYYGVDGEFDTCTPCTVLQCPYCRSEDYIILEEEEEDDE